MLQQATNHNLESLLMKMYQISHTHVYAHLKKKPVVTILKHSTVQDYGSEVLMQLLEIQQAPY